jgi:hypothetical protein
VKSLTTIKEINLPEIAVKQHVKFGILCALQVCKNKKFRSYAKDWLSGKRESSTLIASQIEKLNKTKNITNSAIWALWGAAWEAFMIEEEDGVEKKCAAQAARLASSRAAFAAAADAAVTVDFVSIAIAATQGEWFVEWFVII